MHGMFNWNWRAWRRQLSWHCIVVLNVSFSIHYDIWNDLQSLAVNNFYIGAGADFTGVPTKMLTLNGSLHLSVYNPATFFGIYVTSTPVNFIYADIVIASGQVRYLDNVRLLDIIQLTVIYYTITILLDYIAIWPDWNHNTRTTLQLVLYTAEILYLFLDFTWMQLNKYFQPRKSRRTVLIDVEAFRAPLYGAGSGLVASDNNVIEVPLILKFEIISEGHVVGKLVRTRHRKHISCPLVINSTRNKPIKFKKNSCLYNWSSHKNIKILRNSFFSFIQFFRAL